MKRLFDIFFSGLGLVMLSPLFLLVSLLIKIDSKGPVFFFHQRVGRGFWEFKVFKFRTMSVDASNKGPHVTVEGDKRITKVGRLLRKYKIDELPQLINVLKGDMSLVGPRPEVRKYVEIFKSDYERLLKIRPGITDPASLKYSKEEHILSLSKDWEENYVNKILPEKIKLSSQYVDRQNKLLTDLTLIVKTIFSI